MTTTIEEALAHFAKTAAVCDMHVCEYTFVPPAEVPFSAEVRAACAENLCGQYGTCHTCPPGCGEWDVLAAKYRAYRGAFLYTTLHTLQGARDYAEMLRSGDDHRRMDDDLIDTLHDAGFSDFVLAGAGSCPVCKKCTYPDAPCRFPDKARSAMEALGIDVVALAAGRGITYDHGEGTVTYFSIVFYH